MTTLCKVSEQVPVACQLLFEQLLEQVAHYDAQRLVHIVCRFAMPAQGVSHSSTSSSSLRVMALHVLSASIRFMSAAQLLEEVESAVVPAAIAALNSPLVDLRKASIFVLVEMYLIVGDALYPYLQELSPPQRKLLTIYIEKKIKARNGN